MLFKDSFKKITQKTNSKYAKWLLNKLSNIMI